MAIFDKTRQHLDSMAIVFSCAVWYNKRQSVPDISGAHSAEEYV